MNIKSNYYLKKIYKQLLLVYPDDIAKDILKSISYDVNNFISTNSSAKFDDIVQHIFNPENYIRYGLDSMSPNELKYKILKTYHTKKRTKLALIISLILLIIIVFRLIIDIIDVKNSSAAYVEEEITVLYETTYPDETGSTENTVEPSLESDLIFE